mmetsp:Transcript_34285/g.77491  ORF Transcript_34285/g.77491 Transcript_34285/m.77491 type:complete len:203 (+) Transcript_34285:411-1019(+)
MSTTASAAQASGPPLPDAADAASSAAAASVSAAAAACAAARAFASASAASAAALSAPVAPPGPACSCAAGVWPVRRARRPGGHCGRSRGSAGSANPGGGEQPPPSIPAPAPAARAAGCCLRFAGCVFLPGPFSPSSSAATSLNHSVKRLASRTHSGGGAWQGRARQRPTKCTRASRTSAAVSPQVHEPNPTISISASVWVSA